MPDDMKYRETSWRGRPNFECEWEGCVYADLSETRMKDHQIEVHIAPVTPKPPAEEETRSHTGRHQGARPAEPPVEVREPVAESRAAHEEGDA